MGLSSLSLRPLSEAAQASAYLLTHRSCTRRIGTAFRGRANVDLEDLLHGALQSVLEAAERSRPGLGVLAHPPVVYEADRDGVQGSCECRSRRSSPWGSPVCP